MFNRILSWFTINLAVFLLMTTFLAWIFDTRVLDAAIFTDAITKSGINLALSKAIPEMATRGLSSKDSDKVRAAFAKTVNEAYVAKHVNSLSSDFITYVRGANKPPMLDLSDLPKRLDAQGVSLSADQAATISKPIIIGGNDQSAFKKLQQGYVWLHIIKFVGPFLVVIFLVAEWFLSGRRHRFSHLGRIFISVGLWAFTFWFATTHLSKYILQHVKNQASFANLGDIAKSLIDGVNLILGNIFLIFGLSCLFIGATAYTLHYFLELKNQQEVAKPRI